MEGEENEVSMVMVMINVGSSPRVADHARSNGVKEDAGV